MHIHVCTCTFSRNIFRNSGTVTFIEQAHSDMPASPFPGLGERKGEWWEQVGGAGRRNGGAREEGKETAVGKPQATGNG